MTELEGGLAAEDVGIQAPRNILAIVELELVIHTEDNFLAETIAIGYQYALKVEFARQCPSLALLYDLHTEIVARRPGSRIFSIKIFPRLKPQHSHLPQEMEELKQSIAKLSKEVGELKARQRGTKLLAVVFALTSVLNLGNAAHTFGENWGIIHERARQTIEANHPGTMIDVRQVSLSEPPPDARDSPIWGNWDL